MEHTQVYDSCISARCRSWVGALLLSCAVAPWMYVMDCTLLNHLVLLNKAAHLPTCVMLLCSSSFSFASRLSYSMRSSRCPTTC